jgi:hypothetical protein
MMAMTMSSSISVKPLGWAKPFGTAGRRARVRQPGKILQFMGFSAPH